MPSCVTCLPNWANAVANTKERRMGGEQGDIVTDRIERNDRGTRGELSIAEIRN